MKLEQTSGSELEAIGLGAMVGMVVGGVFGCALALMSGGLFSELGVIVIVHSSLAMTAMGAWITPSLVSREAPEA